MKNKLLIFSLLLVVFTTACKKESNTGTLEVVQKTVWLQPWEFYRIWNQETYIAVKSGVYIAPLYLNSGNGSKSFIIKDMIPGWYGIIIDMPGNQKHESQFYVEPGKTKRIEL